MGGEWHGAHARSTLDNAMFAVSDFTLSPSIDFAYVGHRWTVQAESDAAAADARQE